MKKQALVLVFIILLSIGCEDMRKNERKSLGNLAERNHSEAYDKMLEEANRTCGVLYVNGKQPFFNVTGKLTGDPLPKATVFLHITPSLSGDHALYVAEHCRALWSSIANNSGGFSFPNIIPGKYVLSIEASHFASVRGFPVLEEFNRDGYELNVAFHSGNQFYSVRAFEISRDSSNLRK